MTKLSERAIPMDEAPKQFLLNLHQQGELNDLQLRALSKRLDEFGGGLSGLEKALLEFDAGELRVEDKAANAIRPPSVFDAPEGEGAKQTLIWLFEQGSISRLEMQAAAALVNEAEPPVEREALAEILADVGAVRALPAEDEEQEEEGLEPLAPAVGEDEKIRAELASAGIAVTDVDAENIHIDPSTIADSGDDEPEEFTQAQLDAARQLLTATVPLFKNALQQVSDVDVLDCLHFVESGAAKPRQGVLDAIEERLGEVELAAKPE